MNKKDFKKLYYLILVTILFEIIFLPISVLKNPLIFQDQATKYDFPIQGYSLRAMDYDPMDWDESGRISIHQDKVDLVDISLELEYGFYDFDDVVIAGSVYQGQNGNKMYDYDLTASTLGFFMNMRMSSDMTYIDIAFDGGDVQLCYQNLFHDGYDTFKLLELSKMTTLEYGNVQNEMVLPQLKVTIDGNRNKISSISFNKMKEDLIQNLRNGVEITHLNPQIIDKDGTLSKSSIKGRYYEYKYGVSFEAYNIPKPEVTLPRSLPSFWRQYAGVDIGIYRYLASKSQIRSDLYYYNKDWYSYTLGRGYDNDIIVYAPYAHGPEPHTMDICDTSWQTGERQWLEPFEVSNLWGQTWKYDKFYGWTRTRVYPDEMIILTTVCWGYHHVNDGINCNCNDDYPYMGHAFVDYGAKAFVGATVTVPILHWSTQYGKYDNDVFTEPFWKALCKYGNSVSRATQIYISAHNQYARTDSKESYWYLWTNIKILGDPNARV